MGDHPLDDLLRGQRRDREVETLQPQRRQAEDQADRRGDDRRERDGHPERKAHAGGEDPRRVGADGQEPALPHRDLPGVADQDVEAERADGGDRDLVGEVEPVRAGEEREGEHDDREDGETRLLQRQAPQRHVGAVVGEERARFHAT